MKLIVLLSSILVAQARVAPASERCQNGINIQNVYHDKTVLTSGLDRPYLLTVDFDTETLYFSYNINSDTYKTARINLRTHKMTNIEGIPNGFSSAIDRDHNVIYIGTTDGIYAYNYVEDRSELFGAKGQFIWTLLLKDEVLYYSTYPGQELYALANGESTRVKELKDTAVHNFFLDSDNDMTYDNGSGLYTLKKGQYVAQRYNKEFTILQLRTLTTDLHGMLYACFNDGVYKVNKDQVRLEKVVDIFDAFGLTFDNNNNMIYSDGDKIVKLTPNKDC